MSTLTLLLVSGGLLVQDVAAPGEKRPAVVKPRPVAEATWELKVAEKPRFPEKQWGERSPGASDRGLSVTIQPERTTFPANGPLAFRVVLKNVSEEPFRLVGGARLGLVPKLVFANLKTATQWTLEADFAEKGRPGTIALAPGESLERTLVVEPPAVVVPRPVPLPRPIPQPRPLTERVRPLREDAAAEKPAAEDRRGRPIRPPVVVGPNVPVGRGTIRVQLLMEFRKADEKNADETPVWSGRLASRPVDVEVGPPEARPIPVQPRGDARKK